MKQIAYKLFVLKGGVNLHSLFIHKKEPLPVGEWMEAECYPTNGFAVREGWHCCFAPVAPHLKRQLSSGEIRVWAEVEVKDWEKYDRPESQGGAWILAKYMKINRILSEEEVLEKGGEAIEKGKVA